jgi:hypothetical protein
MSDPGPSTFSLPSTVTFAAARPFYGEAGAMRGLGKEIFYFYIPTSIGQINES